MRKPKAKYIHDCKRCQFIGKYEKMDLYVCNQVTGPSVILRYGDEGSEYMSYPLQILLQPFQARKEI